MTAPESIQRLVSRFEEQLESYRSNKYNEAQLRREFLDPFFEALGWDIFNKQGYAEAYKEVIHEDSLDVEGAAKAPDYAFRVGGQRKFFVEAKKPSVNIQGDIHPAFQLRRYAWSAKLPLGVLTDFEEFAIYDCRSKPDKSDRASTERVAYYSYRDYLEKWEQIAGIFGREAVYKGSFDSYAEGVRGKRGTSQVDDAFLGEIEGWREVLARNFALRNPGLSTRELNYAVQMTIDRIIFLRICEDRQIEPYEKLKNVAAGTGVYAGLCQLFRQADARYNSGLFHFKDSKEGGSVDNLTPALSLDDKVLRQILTGLYYPESPYAFSVISSDILGQVYERFLGKVIRLTAGHQAKVEEKPEVRKAGGVYYTPTYIVDYIVKNTVAKLLEGKTPRQVDSLKILDPACGSGTFLLGAYQTLLDWHLDWYSREEPEKWAKGKAPAIFQGGHGWRLTTTEKKRILLNNIHGVDIDAQAVEVSKLSLLLKVLEGENEETIGAQLAMFQERALPDLGSNIQCGNSLISPDYYEGKLLVDEEERYRVNAFDWHRAFPGVFAQGGFDAVIGNPPYIRIQRISHEYADYIFKKYKSPTSKTDISLVFIEKSLSIIQMNGLVGLICTSQWLTTDYGKNLRKMLSDGNLISIVDFGSLPVFENAQTYPAIFILRASPAKYLSVKRIKTKAELNLKCIEEAKFNEIKLTMLGEEPWNLGSFDLVSLLDEKNLNWKPLKYFGAAYIGALTGMDRAFVVDSVEIESSYLEKNLLLPYAYRGAEIHKYSQVHPNSYVIYPYTEGKKETSVLISEKELKSKYPNIYSHLLNYKDELRLRMDSRKKYASGNDWYRFLRPGSYAYIKPEKLLIKGIELKTVVGMLEKTTVFNGANCPGIILNTLGKHSNLYILGLLNSKITTFYLRMVCPPKLNDYRRFNASNINSILIRTINFSDPAEKNLHDKIVSFVERLLALHKQTARTPQEQEMLQREIEATDRAIDALVYELYGLTEEEIRIVEGV